MAARLKIELQSATKTSLPTCGAVSPAKTFERFYLLDIMRGLASLAVVVWHYQNFFFVSPGILEPGFARSTQPFYSFLALGYEQGWRAVQVFFALSGFVFFHQYGESIRTGVVGARKFFVHRFSRLYPLHLTTLVIVAVGQMVSRSIDGQDIVYPCNDWQHFGLNLLLAVDWMPSRWRCFSFNAPVWSVSIEVLLYFVFFFFAQMLPRRWLGQVVVTMLMLLLGVGLAVNVSQHLGEPILCFYAGGLTALIWSRFYGNRQSLSVIGWIFFSMLGVVLIYLLFQEPNAIILGVIVYPLVIFLLAVLQSFRPRIGRSMRFIGDITYSTYLLHFPIQLGLILLMKSGMVRIDFASPEVWLLFFSLLLICSIPTYYVFERPMQQLLRRRMLPVAPQMLSSEKMAMLIQQGARRNYLYACKLAEAGLLHSLVTDAAWRGPRLERGARFLDLARSLARCVPRLRGPIARRTVAGVRASQLKASLLPNLASAALFWLSPERRFALVDEVLALRCRLRGLDGVSVVVNYQGNGGSFLDHAKAKGAKIVTDFIITPKYLEIERNEHERWPGWETDITPLSVIDFYRRRVSHLVQISDVYLCPSEAVVRDLAELPGFVADRVRLVPYGVSGVLLCEQQTVPGRVLFAGAAGLRKGLPYLAQAATLLKASHPGIEIVVAGEVSPAVASRAETRDLTFLGRLDRQRMAEEFARADVFCLPSLAEGSATSIFEALANGLPVVTTVSSGSVVVNGREGLIVNERSGQAIADAIARIVQHRDLRAAMSEAALASAAKYSDDACGEAFVGVVRELLDGNNKSPGACTWN